MRSQTLSLKSFCAHGYEYGMRSCFEHISCYFLCLYGQMLLFDLTGKQSHENLPSRCAGRPTVAAAALPSLSSFSYVMFLGEASGKEFYLCWVESLRYSWDFCIPLCFD